MRNKRGITLISLVITIIIIIILATITINLIINGGILEYGKQAKEEDKVGQIIEFLDLKVLESKINYFEENNSVIVEKTREQLIDKKEELEKYGEEISIKECIEKENEVYFYVIIDKGIYKVGLNTTEYIGKQTDSELQLQEKDIEFICNPSTWTNENVKVQIKSSKIIEGYSIEYKIDESNIWNVYKEEIEIDKKQTIYARLAGIKGQTTSIPFEISNIDKILPKEIELETEILENSIKITAKTEDNEETNEYGKSGIFGYRFKIDNNEWSKYQESPTYEFTDLQQNIQYEIEVEAKDNAGNINTKKTTVEIESLVISEFTPTIINENGTYFTIDASSATTTDGSNIAEYTYIINGEIHGTTQENQYLVTGLDLSSNYTVQVIATDINGKDKKSESIEYTTADKQYIYKKGNEYSELTGGWTRALSHNAGSGSKGSESINISCPNQVNIYTTYTFKTDKLIDVSKFKKMNFIITVSNLGTTTERWGEVGLYTGTYRSGIRAQHNGKNYMEIWNAVTQQEFSITLTDTDTQYYGYLQGIAGGNGDDRVNVNIYEVWFE